MGKGKVKAEDKEPKPLSVAVVTEAQPYLDILRQRRPASHFTDEEEDAIIKLLAMCDGNSARVMRMAEEAGAPISMGGIWKVMERNMGAFVEQREAWKRSFALRLQHISHSLAEKLAEKVEAEEYSLRDGMVSLGIAVQRGMDLAGEGSTIHHKHTHTVDQAALEAAMERIQQLRQPADMDLGEADFAVRE